MLFLNNKVVQISRYGIVSNSLTAKITALKNRLNTLIEKQNQGNVGNDTSSGSDHSDTDSDEHDTTSSKSNITTPSSSNTSSHEPRRFTFKNRLKTKANLWVTSLRDNMHDLSTIGSIRRQKVISYIRTLLSRNTGFQRVQNLSDEQWKEINEQFYNTTQRKGKISEAQWQEIHEHFCNTLQSEENISFAELEIIKERFFNILQTVHLTPGQWAALERERNNNENPQISSSVNDTPSYAQSITQDIPPIQLPETQADSDEESEISPSVNNPSSYVQSTIQNIPTEQPVSTETHTLSNENPDISSTVHTEATIQNITTEQPVSTETHTLSNENLDISSTVHTETTTQPPPRNTTVPARMKRERPDPSNIKEANVEPAVRKRRTI